jgi:hypothetical protein
MYNLYVLDTSWTDTALSLFTLSGGNSKLAIDSIYGTNHVNKLDSSLVTKTLGKIGAKNAK